MTIRQLVAKPHLYTALFICLWLLSGATSAISAPRLEVTVSEIDMVSGSFAVTVVAHDISLGPGDLRLAPIYVDNPHGLAEPNMIQDLQVETTAPFTITYRIRPEFTAGALIESYPVRLPFMTGERSWFIGNHIFITPRLSDDFVHDLRVHLPITLKFVMPDGLPLVGVPPIVELNNLHELMSIQFGFGEFDRLAGQGADWSWEVFLADGGGLSAAESRLLSGRMAEATSAVADLFGGSPFPSVGMLLVRENFMSGLEGAYCFQTACPPKVDLSVEDDPTVGTYFGVLVHELVHTWLPIGLFASDDPWFKEGVTSYYGDVLTARAGWLTIDQIRRWILRYTHMVHGTLEIEQVKLSDPRLWYEEYTSEAWRRVTYERGCAVAMGLDLLLRQETENSRSLDDVMKVLYAEHLHQTIDRAQLLAAIKKATGVAAEKYFADYVDSAYLPTTEEAQETLASLIELGVYDPR